MGSIVWDVRSDDWEYEVQHGIEIEDGNRADTEKYVYTLF